MPEISEHSALLKFQRRLRGCLDELAVEAAVRYMRLFSGTAKSRWKEAWELYRLPGLIGPDSEKLSGRLTAVEWRDFFREKNAKS